MKYFDSIYETLTLDDWLTPLIKTPVIQRLRWIALSNVPSLSYPMIAGVSRYSHSLGVAYLGHLLSKHHNFNETDHKNLVCAGLLHDAGMPPLGHLTEEALKELGIEYDHEESLRKILLDDGDRFHLMPDGEKVGVIEAINKIQADSSEIFKTITGKGKLGKFLASSMDIDNIDNVIRIFRLIFPGDEGYCPEEIVKNHFSLENTESLYKGKWDEVRKKIYTKLMFSLEDFQQKATLKRIIKVYIKNQLESFDVEQVINSFRFLNDAEFMHKILSFIEDTENHCSFYSGKFDKMISYGWVNDIDSKKLEKLKVELSKDNYYFDFIPDKRFKNQIVNSKKGAIVGLFSFGKPNKTVDTLMQNDLLSRIPNLRENYTPEHDENQQLSFI